MPGDLARKIQSLDLNSSQPESRAFALNSHGDEKPLTPKGGGFSPGPIFVTGLHCVMSVVEMKAGNSLHLPHPCMLSSWLTWTVARPVWTSEKGDAGPSGCGRKYHPQLGYFLRRKDTDT